MRTKLKLKILVVILINFVTIRDGLGQFAQEEYAYEQTAKKGLTEINFVGAGNINPGFGENNKLAASTGLGVLFWRIWPNKGFDSSDPSTAMSGLELQLDVTVNVASTADTIIAELGSNSNIINSRAFGSYILNPVGAGQGTTINSVWYFKPKEHDEELGLTKRKEILYLPIDGFEAGAIASNQVWKVDQGSSVNVSVIAWRIGPFYEFVPDKIRRQKGYSIRFGANYTGRGIVGDAGEGDLGTEMRKRILGHEATHYHGLEFKLSLRLKNIRAEAALPILDMGGNRTVHGLTGAQFITSIGFVGGFPLSIK
ncbi:MAG: hypothetical protein EOO43_00850 [Flavobacterium sp.]|nr:MAG: hypothetical protein EOO43_00850 [Flavobacterium sp.]